MHYFIPQYSSGRQQLIRPPSTAAEPGPVRCAAVRLYTVECSQSGAGLTWLYNS